MLSVKPYRRQKLNVDLRIAVVSQKELALTKYPLNMSTA